MNGESFWEKFAWGKAAFLALCLLALINLLILDIKIFSQGQTSLLEPILRLPTSSPVATTSSEAMVQGGCPEPCLKIISEATTPGKAQVAPAPKSPVSIPAVKEIYIPLGSGSTSSSDWTELVGRESVIDMANYPSVKSIIFEASMRIPTANGRAYAKLYDVTGGHDVWNSEVYAEGLSGYRAESGNLTLLPGRKVYRVMMRSTMGYEAILDSARIKILFK